MTVDWGTAEVPLCVKSIPDRNRSEEREAMGEVEQESIAVWHTTEAEHVPTIEHRTSFGVNLLADQEDFHDKALLREGFNSLKRGGTYRDAAFDWCSEIIAIWWSWSSSIKALDDGGFVIVLARICLEANRVFEVHK